MKGIILGIALIAGISGVAAAQYKTKVETKSNGQTEVKVKNDQREPKEGSPDAIANAETAEMRVALGLSSNQFQQIKEVNLLVERKLASLQNVTDDKTSALEEIKTYKETQYKQILTEEQYNKWRTKK